MRRRPLATLVTALVTAVVLLAANGADATRAHATNLVPVPNAIDRTGNRDVTDELNAFLSTLAPDTTVTFPKTARYRVEGVLVLSDRRDVTIDGNGATFFATTDGSGVLPPRKGGFRTGWPRRREQWDILRGTGIVLRNLTVRGANPHAGATPEAYVPALEGQAGIGISRSNGVVIDTVTVTDTYGDFVWITGASTNVAIRRSTFARSGRQGVAIVNAQGVVVEDNAIRDVARSVFDLEPPARAFVQDIRLQRNRVGAFRNFLLAAGGGGPGVNDIWLEANRVDGGNGVSVSAGQLRQLRHGYHILTNTGTGATSPPDGTGRPGLFQLVNLDGVEIRGNVQGVADGPAISVDRVCNLTVAANQFPGASSEQIELAPCGAPSP